MTKENIAKIFEEIKFMIRNAKNYLYISDEIYRIYNQNPQDFLAAIQFIPLDTKCRETLPHQAVEQSQLEIIIIISKIKENVIKTFKEIESAIQNAVEYPNIGDEIYRIYNKNPQDFLTAISLNFLPELIYCKPLLHQAAEQGQLEIIIIISEIYALSKTTSKSYSRESSSKNVKNPQSILGREISGPRIIVPKKNELLELEEKDNGYRLLHNAVFSSHLNVTKWLINNGANLNSLNKYFKNPLILSVFSRNYQAFSLLLENRADVHLIDNIGYSVLHYAAQYDIASFVKELLKYGADINCLNFNENTPLCLASSMNNLETVKILVEHAKEQNIRLIDIESAIAVTNGPQAEEIVEILQATLESYENKAEEALSIELASTTPFTQKNNIHNLRG